MKRSLSSRPRGRPSAQRPPARDLLLDALLQILEAAPLSRPSQREVAQAADVSAALLHYHFGDQSGLLRCLLQERALPLLQPLLQELQSHSPTAAASLTRFLQKWTTLARRHRWLAACLLQLPRGDDGLKHCGASLRAAVVAAQREGAVRRDLPDSYLALLLLSLGLMPHLAQTSLGDGLDPGLLIDAESAAGLTLLHLAVLGDGVTHPGGSRAQVA